MLFGTIGAALIIAQLQPSDVGRSFVCIICAQAMRFIAVFFVSYSPKYTIKERLFMSLSWIPKSTVPATVASVVYTESLAKGAGWEDYQAFGLNIQTTTILSIILCEPIGSFLIDQFAPKLLTIDPSDPAYVAPAGEDAEKEVVKTENGKTADITQEQAIPAQE